MTPPKDKQIIKGEIADYYFDGKVLVSISKGVKRTVENIGRNVELVKSITNNTPIPLLIYLADSPVPDKATRAFLKNNCPLFILPWLWFLNLDFRHL